MAGTLSVQKIQGLATSATPTTIEIASGHKLTGAAGSVIATGAPIQVQSTNNNTHLSYSLNELSLPFKVLFKDLKFFSMIQKC